MMRNNKYQESRNRVDHVDDYFRVKVTHVDQNETIDDMQKVGRLQKFSPHRANRGFHLAGVRMDGEGTILVDIVIPPRVAGDFTLPKKGDIVWCYQKRGGVGLPAVFMYSEYSGGESVDKGDIPAPMFGSMPGDYGHLRTYIDHNVQFLNSAAAKAHKWEGIPQVEGNFITRFVRSITGFRFRDFYKSNLKPKHYVLRGDNVFDIDPNFMTKEVVEGDGVNILPSKVSQALYPNPLNVPKTRELDPNFTYMRTPYSYLPFADDADPFEETSSYNKIEEPKYDKLVGYKKNYVAYHPIIDGPYKKKANFERELPAAEEYKVGVKGDNQLYIGDMSGDMEQILILLKNMYDAGLAIVQNEDKSQLRLRDHVGNTILLEGDRERPRTILVTPNRQVIEMGGIKGKGEFVYIRNGTTYGKPDVPWGVETNKEKSNSYNQEILMVDHENVLQDSEFSERISPGLADIALGAGIFLRTVDDSSSAWEKYFALWESNGSLNEKMYQKWGNTETSTVATVDNRGSSASWISHTKVKGSLVNKIEMDNSNFKITRNSIIGSKVSTLTLNDASTTLDTQQFLVNSKLPIVFTTPMLDIV